MLPLGEVGTNIPVGTLPRMLKWYQISSRRLPQQATVTGKPWAAVRAAWILTRVYVAIVEGTIPALARVLICVRFKVLYTQDEGKYRVAV